jgi:hypothetical protein
MDHWNLLFAYYLNRNSFLNLNLPHYFFFRVHDYGLLYLHHLYNLLLNECWHVLGDYLFNFVDKIYWHWFFDLHYLNDFHFTLHNSLDNLGHMHNMLDNAWYYHNLLDNPFYLNNPWHFNNFLNDLFSNDAHLFDYLFLLNDRYGHFANHLNRYLLSKWYELLNLAAYHLRYGLNIRYFNFHNDGLLGRNVEWNSFLDFNVLFHQYLVDDGFLDDPLDLNDLLLKVTLDMDSCLVCNFLNNLLDNGHLHLRRHLD